MANKSYYPDLGVLMPNGNLRIPTAGVSEDGERWDGYEEIDAKHASYNEWLGIIEKRGPLLESLQEAKNKRNEERRARLKGNSKET